MLPKLHAEISCINQIKNLNINFSKVKLYIYRIRKDQPFGLARPCPSCMAAIKDLGIKNIYYTTNDGYSHEHLENINIGGVA
jgi:tRNA(Arg) A34 adenosine deaminase TadA